LIFEEKKEYIIFIIMGIIYHKISMKNKIDPSMKKGRFSKTARKSVSVLLRIKGTLARKDIFISNSLTENSNYVSVKCGNQSLILESNITKKINSWNKKEYDISNIQLNMGDYTLVLKFIVRSLLCDDSNIILGSPWLETLGSSILNTKKLFLTLSSKNMKIMLQDIKLDSNLVTSEDLKDISNIILQDNQKIVQKMQKYFDKVVAVKGEEIYRLKNHS
jgi:hypothetical protein